MKKLLGLLAVAPMALAACSGNEADKETSEQQTTITEAYENTNYLTMDAELEALTDTSTELNTDYNESIMSVNNAGLGSALGLEESNNFMKHDWSKENNFEVAAGGDTFNLVINYELSGDTLYSRLQFEGLGEEMDTYIVYDFEIKNDKLEITTHELKKDDTVSVTVSGDDSHVSYDQGTNSRLEALKKDGDDYVVVIGESDQSVYWDTTALNSTNNKSLSITTVETSGEDVIHNHFDATETDALNDLMETVVFPTTTETWSSTIAKDAFPTANLGYAYADVVAKFA